MNLTEPIVFEPLFMERVWGGRRMETLFAKHLPACTRIGESWELVDREEAQSVVHLGPLRGVTLHELWTKHREEIFGRGLVDSPRFPLLFKLLDAQERLSVQVHPPAEIALQLGGEPKTEMWYLLDTLLESDILAGLKRGVTRADFEKSLQTGEVAELVHKVAARPGDAIMIPSGRIHAIGIGNLVFEVQQNSDTTYRVFDWNRLGLDGKARPLHVAESLASINFEDSEPAVAQPVGETVVSCPYFLVEEWDLQNSRCNGSENFATFFVRQGVVRAGDRLYGPGQLFLIPPALAHLALEPAEPNTKLLRTTIPIGSFMGE